MAQPKRTLKPEIVDYINRLNYAYETNGASLEYAQTYFQIADIVRAERFPDDAWQYYLKARDVLIEHLFKKTKKTVWEIEALAQMAGAYPDEILLYYKILRMTGFVCFEDFIFYMEKNRPQDKRFYLPRRKTLKVVVDDLQELEYGDLKFYGLSLPSRVGKSTLCIFFLSWIALRKPNSHSAMVGHSGTLAKGFYKELCNFILSEEYCFADMWGAVRPARQLLRDKSAEDLTITLDKPDRFATVTCRGIDGTLTGAVDISSDGYLYVDDLVRDRQHSLSPQRMESTWQEYLNKCVDRKIDGAKELMVGTLWNVMDPLERLRKKYEDDPQYRFRRIPALNENDESNFDYVVNGFSTQYYRDMRERLDNAEWMAKYMQKPYIRDGLLFEPDELRYFNGILPDGDYRIVSAVDVAWGGGDSLSMPIGAEYENGDVYIFDWVFNNGPKETTLPLVTGQIIANDIREIRFEGNTGGDLYCQYVEEKLIEQHHACSCSSKKAPNRMDKVSKIIAYSGDIKRRYVFLSENSNKFDKEEDALNGIKRYTRSKEYQKAMEELTMFVTIGKNEHDDAADGLTQLEMFISGGTQSLQAQIVYGIL